MDVFKLAPDRRTELEQEKNSLEELSDAMFVATIRQLKDGKQKLENDLKHTQLLLEAAVEQAHERFERNGYDVLSFPDHGRLSIGFDVYPQIISKESAIQWLKDNDCAEIVKEDVSWQTLKSLIKEKIEKAEELPNEDIIHLYMKPKINFRR